MNSSESARELPPNPATPAPEPRAALTAAPWGQAICTLGMHRSGTSLVSRLLQLLGVQLGPAALLATPAPDNPRGYWEHYPLSLLNDEILGLFGGRWDDPPQFPPDWTRDPRLTALRERARELLHGSFAGEPLWAWKDPRSCLTLPFWQELVGPLRYVVCVRNPRAVVDSLSRREDFRDERSAALWLRYTRGSLAHSAGQARLLVCYEDVLREGARELERLAAFVGRPERAADPTVRAAAAECIETELCHHRASSEELAGDPRLPFAAKALYFALRSHVEAQRGAPAGAQDPRAERALERFADASLQGWEQHAAARAERERLERELAAQLTARQALGELLAQQQGPAQVDLHAERNLAARADELLRERDGARRQHAAALAALGEIDASCAWRLVGLARGALGIPLPPGTRRRQALRRLLGALRTRAAQPVQRAAPLPE